MIIRYKWTGVFSAFDANSHIPAGFTVIAQGIGPGIFVDQEVTPDPTPQAQQDLDKYMASLGWEFVETSPTMPINSGIGITVYDSVGGQSFTGTVQIVFDTVQKNMSASVYTFDGVLGTIEVLVTGIYSVCFDIGLGLSGTSRTNSRSFLTRNAVVVPGTDAFGYHRNNAAGLDTAHTTTILDLVANDILAVSAQRVNTGSTLVSQAQGSRLTVRQL